MPTSPKGRAEEIAIAIGKKAVSDDYVEDGGYIRDWLVADIAKALEEYAERERAEGFLEGCSKESQRVIAKLAFNQGAASMRERAAKVAENTGNECLNCLDSAAKAIRALPITPGEATVNHKGR